MSTLSKLQDWYLSQCNEDWEHQYGVRLETLDNPGWLLTIDLENTDLSNHPYPGFSYGTGDDSETSGDDWVDCKVQGYKFVAAGGPRKLEEMINIFLEWAASGA